MILKLKHEPVGGGVPQFASEVDAGRHVIGRDEENSLVLDIESVSREHACFFDARGRWFFVDLGSTNGSWVNGTKVGPQNVRLLRDGDLVQLANVALRVNLVLAPDERADELEDVPSIFVFRETEFEMEFPLASSSSRLSLPDLQGYLSLQDREVLPAMTINFRPGKLELVVATDNAKIGVNGNDWGGTAGAGRTLYDRDELDVGQIKLVVCDLATAKVARDRQIKAALASLPQAPSPEPPAPHPAAEAAAYPPPYSSEPAQPAPRVTSHGEPSAAIGSGSGLFGAGRPPSGPASSPEGRIPLPEGDLDPARRKPPRYVFGQAADGEAVQFTGGISGGAAMKPRPQAGEVSGSQRFVPPAQPEEEEEATTGNLYAIIGAIALVLLLILVGLLVSIFYGI
jgi:hypothetical protein